MNIPISKTSWIAKNYIRHNRLNTTRQWVEACSIELTLLKMRSRKLLTAKEHYSKKDVKNILQLLSSVKQDMAKATTLLDDTISKFSTLYTFKK